MLRQQQRSMSCVPSAWEKSFININTQRKKKLITSLTFKKWKFAHPRHIKFHSFWKWSFFFTIAYKLHCNAVNLCEMVLNRTKTKHRTSLNTVTHFIQRSASNIFIHFNKSSIHYNHSWINRYELLNPFSLSFFLSLSLCHVLPTPLMNLTSTKSKYQLNSFSIYHRKFRSQFNSLANTICIQLYFPCNNPIKQYFFDWNEW